MHELKIPEQRVACLIGTRGVTKRLIEQKTHTRLLVSKEGEIVLEGEHVDTYLSSLICKAIGRGFNPSIALLLLNEAYGLELLTISEFTGKQKKKQERIKARLIGTEGKARMHLERLTGCHIVVFGKTVGIIGSFDVLDIARRGIEKLLGGAPHGNVYRYLEIELKKRETSS